ncbi:MAG: DUF177 domain-containing protein [Lachnospiraceae bacterium]|nr:DUF177 domain-containing protein [Lachnospiraceae bacterium]
MFINLTDVFTSDDKVITMQAEIEMNEISTGREVYKLAEKSPVDLTFTNVGKGKARIDGQAEVALAMNCDRCLKPVSEKVILNFSREVYAPDAVEGMSEEEDDQNFMDGYQLNVEDLLINEIIINWPMKVLCKPDCKGICRQCGKDLNTGTCSCDTSVPDPRMAVIKDIFNANKEV